MVHLRPEIRSLRHNFGLNLAIIIAILLALSDFSNGQCTACVPINDCACKCSEGTVVDISSLGHKSGGPRYSKVSLLRSSGISRKSGTLIFRYNQKKECISFVFYCFDNLSIVITLEPLVRSGWSFQQNVPLLMRTSNRKMKMSHVRLPTDSPRSHHKYFCSKASMVSLKVLDQNTFLTTRLTLTFLRFWYQ